MRFSSLLLGGLGGVVLLVGRLDASADTIREPIIRDTTLPQPSEVTRNGNRTVITGGTERGSNLFHSFRAFSVPEGGTASFQGINPAIARILMRVTGSSRSRINGTIEALQANGSLSSADVFLINPNGIIFGPNASLRLGGSFIASTADQITFADGTQFSAVAPAASPLLTVSVPTGLQFGNTPGRIVNQAVQTVVDESENPVLDAEGFPQVTGLEGNPGETLALIGGNVLLTQNGVIRSNGGRVEIGSVGSTGQAFLTPIPNGWDVTYPLGQSGGDILMELFARIDTTGPGGGAIELNAGQIAVLDPLTQIISGTLGSGRGGNLTLTATEFLVVSGDNASIRTETRGSGRAGDITIFAPQLVIQDGGRIGSFSFRQGQGGTIRVVAPQSVTIAGVSPELESLSLLYVQTRGSGTAGNIEVTTDRLEVLAGGQISTTTFGAGDAGNLTVRANQVDLVGIALDRNGRPLLSDGLPAVGGLVVGTTPRSTGNGGMLRVTTQRLNLREGALLQATTYGQGEAGDVTVRASEAIDVSGTSEQGGFRTGIAASSGGLPDSAARRIPTAVGGGGNLTLTTERLTVRDGAIVAVNSLNPEAAGAGSLQVQARTIVLDQGRLNAETESGNNARIQLQGVDFLLLRRNSDISTSAGLTQGGGDGGNIEIGAEFILDAPLENSDITANAGEGNGGNITIDATGIFGLVERPQTTPLSDITASSESGVDGEISLSTPAIDPTRGLVELPTATVDASQLIAQGCGTGTRRTAQALGEFVITGRGGLPPNPGDLRGSSAVISDWATLPPSTTPAAASASPLSAVPPSSASLPELPATAPALVEAQGWVMGADGRITLVAQAATAVPHHSGFLSPSCEGS
ncbi:MAG: S-layer family protein [Synechococcales cyanobacterium M58_A2018_015]|nr:S-layer family protein [Synechococcales cyanobacterium M58_A2018_015]